MCVKQRSLIIYQWSAYIKQLVVLRFSWYSMVMITYFDDLFQRMNTSSIHFLKSKMDSYRIYLGWFSFYCLLQFYHFKHECFPLIAPKDQHTNSMLFFFLCVSIYNFLVIQFAPIGLRPSFSFFMIIRHCFRCIYCVNVELKSHAI